MSSVSSAVAAAAQLSREQHTHTQPVRTRFPVPALPAVPSPFPLTCLFALPYRSTDRTGAAVYSSSWGGLVLFYLHSSKRLSVYGWAESLQQPILVSSLSVSLSLCLPVRVRSVRVTWLFGCWGLIHSAIRCVLDPFSHCPMLFIWMSHIRDLLLRCHDVAVGVVVRKAKQKQRQSSPPNQ